MNPGSGQLGLKTKIPAAGVGCGTPLKFQGKEQGRYRCAGEAGARDERIEARGLEAERI